MQKRTLLKGAAIIAAGGFISKLIGAFYKIPLTNLIGGYGLGLYQMVYPFYCLLLTVSATGIPSSIACLSAERVSRGVSSKPVLKTAMRLFFWIGLIGSFLMIFLSPILSSAQGEKGLIGGYIALAPSVLITSAISVYRGYFQGLNKMTPTAVSEIIEQAVKVGFGLFFAYSYRNDIIKAVTLLLFSVSLSELIALLFMTAVYAKSNRAQTGLNEEERISIKSVTSLSLPVTFSSALFPLSTLLDSILLVRLMKRYTIDGVTKYGLFSGGATTIVNLPASVCYGLAAASIPQVAAAASKVRETELEKPIAKKELSKRVFSSLFLTAFFSFIGSVALFFLADPTVRIVFRALNENEKLLTVQMIKGLSIGTVFLSCAQTLSACLTAMRKPRYSFYSSAIAVSAKTLLNVLLVARPEFSIFGAVIATDVCYFVDFFCNLLYNLRAMKTLADTKTDEKKPRVFCVRRKGAQKE